MDQRLAPKLDYLPALDGLRGVAVVLVLLVHTAVPHGSDPVLPLGWAGVDLFFVLSGFLITRILLATRNSSRYFSNFYARRILRIWPVYFAVLSFVFILEREGLFHAYASAAAWLCLVTFTQNLYMGAFGWNAVPDWLEPTWSLGVEEQFYLLWPFLVRNLSIRALKTFCIAVIIVTPILRAMVSIYVHQEDAATLLTFCRFDTLCFGTLLAINHAQGHSAYGRSLLRWSLPALVLFFAIYEWAPAVVNDALEFSLLGVVFTGTVALCLTPGAAAGGALATTLLSSAALRFVGRVSYALYLSHTAVFAIMASHPAQRVLGHIPGYDPRGLLQIGINWAAAFTVAVLSWYLFESPILRFKRFFGIAHKPDDLAEAAQA